MDMRILLATLLLFTACDVDGSVTTMTGQVTTPTITLRPATEESILGYTTMALSGALLLVIIGAFIFDCYQNHQPAHPDCAEEDDLQEVVVEKPAVLDIKSQRKPNIFSIEHYEQPKNTEVQKPDPMEELKITLQKERKSYLSAINEHLKNVSDIKREEEEEEPLLCPKNKYSKDYMENYRDF